MDDVRRSVAVLAARFRDAHTARVRLPLGFTSWEAYYGAEFGISRAQAHPLLDVAHALIAVSDHTDVVAELITGGRGPPPRPSSPTAPPGVGTALVSAVVRIGLVLVEDGGSVVLPLPAEEVFRLGGIGETFDRAVCHVQLAAEGSAAVAGFQQCVNRGVSGPDTVGEPVTGWRGEPEASSGGVGSGAVRGAGSGTRTRRHPRCWATLRSAASPRLCHKCHLSATWTARGAPVTAPFLSRSASQGRPLPVGTPRTNAGRVGETVCS